MFFRLLLFTIFCYVILFIYTYFISMKMLLSESASIVCACYSKNIIFVYELICNFIICSNLA